MGILIPIFTIDPRSRNFKGVSGLGNQEITCQHVCLVNEVTEVGGIGGGSPLATQLLKQD